MAKSPRRAESVEVLFFFVSLELYSADPCVSYRSRRASLSDIVVPPGKEDKTQSSCS